MRNVCFAFVLIVAMLLPASAANVSPQDAFERGDVAFVQFTGLDPSIGNPVARVIKQLVKIWLSNDNNWPFYFSHPGIMVGVDNYDLNISDQDEQLVQLLADFPSSNASTGEQISEWTKIIRNKGTFTITSDDLATFKTINAGFWFSGNFMGIRAKNGGLGENIREKIVNLANDWKGKRGRYVLLGSAADKKNFIDQNADPKDRSARSDGFVEYIYEQANTDILPSSDEGLTTTPLAQWNALTNVSITFPIVRFAKLNYHEVDPAASTSWPYRALTVDPKHNGSGVGRLTVVKLDAGGGSQTILDRPQPTPVLQDTKVWPVDRLVDLDDGRYEIRAWDGAGNRTEYPFTLVHRRGEIKVRVKTYGARFTLVNAQNV